MIPKLYHQIWLSGGDIPPGLRVGLDSIRKVDPEIQIKSWSAKDFESDDCSFFNEAIDRGLWAFATDYARLKVLAEHGGVYSDGDVRFYKSIEPLRNFGLVIPWETDFWLGPHFIMAEPRHEFIKSVLDVYRNRTLLRDGFIDVTPMPVYFTWMAWKRGLVLNGAEQHFRDTRIISANKGTVYLSKSKTYCQHLYHGGWTDAGQPFLSQIEASYARSRTTSKRALRALTSVLPRSLAYYICTIIRFEKMVPAAEAAVTKFNRLARSRYRPVRIIGTLLRALSVIRNSVKFDPRVNVSFWHRRYLHVDGEAGVSSVKNSKVGL